jgi:dihydrolipoamide dehydrogenase
MTAGGLRVDEKDVVVIGGGTAGFLAAQIAAQLGGRVMLIEKEKLGGICPNWGCIPMCFMDRCVEVIRTIKMARSYGLETGKMTVDYRRLINEKEKTVKGVVAGMQARLRMTGVHVVSGSARFISPDRIEITSDAGVEIIKANKTIIATGSRSRRYDVPGASVPGVFTAKELLDLRELPKSLVIIGRSVTALELAAIWANLGSTVSLIARKPRLLPNEDAELAAYLGKSLSDDGVRIYTGEIEQIDESESGKRVVVTGEDGRQEVEAQFAVFALGQEPCVDGIGLENVGIAVNDGRIKTNQRMETSVKGIYAAGDVTGEMMLASVAMVQGMVAGRNAMGGSATVDYRAVPRAVRTVPPMASVGITEEQALKKGLDVKIGVFSFEQSPKAGIFRENRGFVKIIVSASGEVLGTHIIGLQASELIHESAVVMKKGGTAQDIASVIHGHPSLHETVQRAAQSLYN